MLSREKILVKIYIWIYCRLSEHRNDFKWQKMNRKVFLAGELDCPATLIFFSKVSFVSIFWGKIQQFKPIWDIAWTK
jgi:hypothetical protein